MSAIVDITCANDADFYRLFRYITTAGDPIDLTGRTMRMGIRHRAEDAVEEMLLTTENGGLAIIDAPNGRFTVLITQDQLVRMKVGEYEHSLIVLAATAKTPVWSGSLIINAGPSR